ncbi:uncharacterized protein LOC134686106 isoform X2 [Mytilus trossulus]|uniref:uncharacterized protein LOC134686106 isoform X2 n=1 Tax=Mytilus trossulus TaxID=6551 RepID=UPI0030073132
MSKTNPKVKVNKRIHERKTGGDAGYKDCVSTEEQSEYEEVNPNPTRSHRKTNVNIALNITNKGSNQVNSWLKTNRVPWRLLLFISGFVITIVLTIIVTFFSTKDKCSEKKTQQHTSCLSNPCLHSGSCYESGKNYACVCPNGTEGSRCQDEFYEAITSHGYPLEYNIQSPKTWNINVGDGNTVRIKFTDFVLSAGEDVKGHNWLKASAQRPCIFHKGLVGLAYFNTRLVVV